MTPHLDITRSQVDAFQAELDALRARVLADLGEPDARHIRRVVRMARASAVLGRSLLALGFDPLTFAVGVWSLSLAKILENMEVGHNVIHGQYDWMNDPTLDSRTYEWDMTCAAEDWRRAHNDRHHVWTNVLGVDLDFGYGVFRMSGEQPWAPYHLVQPLANVVLATLFQWGIGAQDIKGMTWMTGDISSAEIRDDAKPFVRKAMRQVFKDYVLFPWLTPWNAPRVFAGNLLANTTRNLWTHAVVFCGHFTAGVHTFTPEEVQGETRGDWYVRQVLSSSNIEGSRPFHVLTGHLSHQIEHHLFPDLPAPRYPEIAAEVRAACERYGIPYHSGSFVRQYASVVARLFRFALPPRRATT